MEVNVKTDSGESLELIPRKIHKEKFTPFYMIGKAGYSKITGGSIVDAMKEILKFNKGEQWMMGIIFEDGENHNLQCVIRGKALSKTDKNKLSVAYKSLREKDIIRRVKREYYMVNPTFLVPSKDRESLYEFYNTLT